jgi:tetratricopeptide (TPR) repeat protein
METQKIVNDLVVKLKYQANSSPRSCFVVYSSRESHVEVVIDCIEAVFQKPGNLNLDVLRLGQCLKSGDSQYEELHDLLSTCCFAIVILDGFRPNVLFEYGILKGLGKPCIVLLSEGATVDIKGFFPDSTKRVPSAPTIDMDKHFSDVKDRFYKRYDRNNPKQIRSILLDEYKKMKGDIDREFLNSIFPYQDIIKKELSAHLTTIVNVFNKNPNSVELAEIKIIDNAHSHIVRIAKEHSIILPLPYFTTLARTYANAKDYDRAISILDNCLSEAKGNPLLLSEKDYICRRAGRIEDSLRVLNDAIRLHPGNEYFWHNKAVTLEALKKLDEAEICYKEALTLHGGFATLHFHYGILLYQKGDISPALKEFNKALRIRPGDRQYLLWKARTLDASNKIVAARNIVKALLLKDPKNANAWFVLGQIEQDEKKSLQCYQKVLQLEPNHPEALCSSAAQLSNLGRYNEALNVFEKAPELCQKHRTCERLIYGICITMSKLGRVKDALLLCNKFLSKNPNSKDAMKVKAILLARNGKTKDAIKLFHDLLAENPKDSGLLYEQACIFAFAHKPREAARSLIKAIAINAHHRHDALTDSDFDAIRQTIVFRNALKDGKKRKKNKQ